MNEGFIMLHRKILGWEWHTDVNTFSVFIHLLLLANHSPNKWRGIDIGRGQLVTSVASLSKQTGLSVRNVRTCINRLKSTNEVTIKTTNKYSIVTICKYDCYQSSVLRNDKQNDKGADNQTTNKRQTSDKQTTTNNNDNNEKNNNNGNMKVGKPTFTPPSYDEIKLYIKENNLRDVGNDFFLYYESNGWMVGRNPMKNWKSALKRWEMKNKTQQNDDMTILHNNDTNKFNDEKVW